jgi:peptide/nickel transport system permease protein
MQLLSHLAQRIIYSAVLLLAVIVLNFCLIHIAPGDPAEVIAGEMGGATAEMLAAIRATYGLDKPLHEQLYLYLSKVVQGDLGYSFFFDTPVTSLILARLFPTIVLVVSALLVAICVGTLLGVIASRNPYGLFSHVVTVLALVSYSAPVFWTGIMLLILLASFMPIFPVSGMYDITLSGGGVSRFLDILHHMVLPVATLASIYLAIYSRLARAAMLDVLGSDYIRTARAKGLSEHIVVYKHALRNALLPVVTLAGLQFGQLFSGAVLVETVFSWPGLGTLAFDSILRRDSPTLLGILFFSTLMVIIANILTDLSYRLIDPRIRARHE